jgi:hypothetical protein
MKDENVQVVYLKKTAIVTMLGLAFFMLALLIVIFRQGCSANERLEELRKVTTDIKEVSDDVGRINGTVKVKK